MNGVKLVIPRAAERLVPPLLPVEIQLDYPIINSSPMRSQFVARDGRGGRAAQDKPAVGCLFHTIQYVIRQTTERVLPELSSIRIHLDDPKIRTTVAGTCLVSRSC